MEEQKPRPNFAQDVTNKVLALLEGEGVKPWETSWDRSLTKAFNPHTRVRGRHGREYRGANALNLLMGQLARESADPRWLTFNQAKDAGLSIRAGAKAETVMYWQFPESKAKDVAWSAGTDKPAEHGVYQLKSGQYAAYGRVGWMKEADTIEAAQQMRVVGTRARTLPSYQWAPVDDLESTARIERPRPMYFQVFNGADVLGMPPMKERRTFEANERAERLIQATGAVIDHREMTNVGGVALINKAFYDHGTDEITVPPRGHFKTVGDYYRTVIHEIAHWTGHESRLNRGLDEAKRGTPEYVAEELRAEMASAMLCTALGVEGGLQDHAAYLDDYITLLKGDRSAIFKASRDAEKIYNMVLDFDPELRAELESHLGENTFSTGDLESKKQGVDLRKIIKGDLPSFAPIKPVATTPEAVTTAPVSAPTPPAAPVSPPAPAPAPVAAPDTDIEIDFGGLRLGGDAETRIVAGAVPDDDEIALDDLGIGGPGGDLEGEFAEIEVGSPSP